MAHTPVETLERKLALAAEQVTVGAQYRHYASVEKVYTVLHVGLQESTEEVCVVYVSSLSPELVWVRNLDDWTAIVTNAADEKVSRFTKI